MQLEQIPQHQSTENPILNLKNYKKIVLQELQERAQVKEEPVTEKELRLKMNKKYRWLSNPYLHYEDSGIKQNKVIPNYGVYRVNSFFDAFLNAYTKHGDIALVPDEIWIMITFFMSTYIDKHAEKLRPKLVKHEGVKSLKVCQIASNEQESLEMEKKWDNFFDQILKKIEENTNKEILQSFACDFSTTNKTYKVISAAVVMNSLQKLFLYHRSVCVCGINNVYMAGTRQDWIKMIPKLENMVQFDVDGQLKKYVQHMKVILENFVNTFDQKPDLEWWNLIMKSVETQKIYGGQQVEVDGWILNFFGIYQKKALGFPQMSIKVPITLTNQYTNTQKQLKLVADFFSISKLDNRTYKPDVNMCIVQMSSKKP